MGENEEKKAAFQPPPLTPKLPGRPEEGGWPSPMPLPAVPNEDVGRLLKQIVDRLDAIEKRLAKIEKILAVRQPEP